MASTFALLLGLSGCGLRHTAEPHLVLPGTPNQVTETSPNVSPDMSHTYGGMIVCLDRRGAVTVTNVQPTQAHDGIEVTDFGLRPSPYWKGSGAGVDGAGGLAKNHFPRHRKVTVTCDTKTGRGYELAVVVSRTTTRGVAYLHGFKISYSSGRSHGSVVWPLTIVLCPKPRKDCSPGA